MGVWLLNLLVFYRVLILFFEVFRLYVAPLFMNNDDINEEFEDLEAQDEEI
ncbi:transmembrane protein, putative [Medicago truncatula]|uniref:Transmembrane protein, putative n=1 Tax=Medicago truncatula TaxID=3880 RepID=A0A072VIH5_MEDTR|nr:transmembrane protein, putative [Medicago truncatula]